MRCIAALRRGGGCAAVNGAAHGHSMSTPKNPGLQTQQRTGGPRAGDGACGRARIVRASPCGVGRSSGRSARRSGNKSPCRGPNSVSQTAHSSSVPTGVPGAGSGTFASACAGWCAQVWPCTASSEGRTCASACSACPTPQTLSAASTKRAARCRRRAKDRLTARS